MSGSLAETQKKIKEEFEYMRIRKWITFCVIYFLGYRVIENRVSRFHIIDTPVDTWIPFCKIFVIPYLLWFLYAVLTILFFCKKQQQEEESNRLLKAYIIGAVVFFVVSLCYPNIQYLRPAVVGNDVFGKLIKMIYSMDTATNILPSLHVYISVACYIAIAKNEMCRKRKGLVLLTFFLTVMIILSTMLIKQHSIVDVVVALFLNAIVYCLLYREKT